MDQRTPLSSNHPDDNDDLEWVVQEAAGGDPHAMINLTARSLPQLAALRQAEAPGARLNDAAAAQMLLAAVQQVERTRRPGRFAVFLAAEALRPPAKSTPARDPEAQTRLAQHLLSAWRIEAVDAARLSGLPADQAIRLAEAQRRPGPPLSTSLYRQPSAEDLARWQPLAQQIFDRRQEQRRSGRQRRSVVEIALLVVFLSGFALAARQFWGAPPPANPQSTPAPPPTPRTLAQGPSISPVNDSPSGALYYRARQGDTLDHVADHLGWPVSALLAFNQAEPNAPMEGGQRVVLDYPRVAFTPDNPTSYNAIQVIAMGADVSPKLLQQRVLASHLLWRRLWLEAQVVDYSPADFVNGPQLTRYQAWVAQPDHSLVLSGSDVYRPEVVALSLGDELYTWRRNYRENSLPAGHMLSGMPLNALVYPRNYLGELAPGLLRIIEKTELLGREAIVVEAVPVPGRGLVRFVVDAMTGLVLSQQMYDASNPNQLVREVHILALEIDPVFPDDLFGPRFPSLTSYVSGVSAQPLRDEEARVSFFRRDPALGRERLPLTTPPPDYANPRAELKLQFESWGTLEAGPFYAYVFSDSYYLGRAGLGNELNPSCRRSLDGSRLAYLRIEKDARPTSTLVWFDLASPLSEHTPLTQTDTLLYSFSPDGRRLALVGCSRGESLICSLYLADLDSLEPARQLFVLANIETPPVRAAPDSFVIPAFRNGLWDWGSVQEFISTPVWSADSRYLGVLTLNQARLGLFDVAAADRGELLSQWYTPDQPWTLESIRVDLPDGGMVELPYPAEQTSLSDCRFPPAP